MKTRSTLRYFANDCSSFEEPSLEFDSFKGLHFTGAKGNRKKIKKQTKDKWFARNIRFTVNPDTNVPKVLIDLDHGLPCAFDRATADKAWDQIRKIFSYVMFSLIRRDFLSSYKNIVSIFSLSRAVFYNFFVFVYIKWLINNIYRRL